MLVFSQDPEELRGALDQSVRPNFARISVNMGSWLHFSQISLERFFEHFHKHIFHPVVHRLEALATREDEQFAGWLDWLCCIY